MRARPRHPPLGFCSISLESDQDEGLNCSKALGILFRILPGGFRVIRPSVFKVFLTAPTCSPLGFCWTSLKYDQDEGRKCWKICVWIFFRILGDTSLRFQSTFGSLDMPPLGFCWISLKCDHAEGLKCWKICVRNFFPDFAGWILGDTSLCFQSIFGGSDGAPFRILLNFEKIGHFKKCGQP